MRLGGLPVLATSVLGMLGWGVLAQTACNSPDAVHGGGTAGGGTGGTGGGVQPNGEACDEPAECASELCVDGVCCESECSGACETCAGAEPGICEVVGPGALDDMCVGVCWDDAACVPPGAALCHATANGTDFDYMLGASVDGAGAITVVGRSSGMVTFSTPTGSDTLNMDSGDGYRLSLDLHCGFVDVEQVGGGGEQGLYKVLPAGTGHLLAGINAGTLETTGPPFSADSDHDDAFLLYMNARGSIVDTEECHPLVGTDGGDCAQYYGIVAVGASNHEIVGLGASADNWFLGVNFTGFFYPAKMSDGSDGLILEGPNGDSILEATGMGEQTFGGLAVLSNGDLVVGGDTDTTFSLASEPIDLLPGDQRNMFLAHRVGPGAWNVKRVGHSATESLTGMAPAGDGYVVIGDYVDGQLDLDGPRPLPSAGMYQTGFVARFDASDAPVWNGMLAPIGGAFAGVNLHSVEVDHAGYIVIAGDMAATGVTWTSPTGVETSFDSAQDNQAFVGKLDPDGEMVWMQIVDGLGSQYLEGLAVHPVTGAVTVLGHSTETVLIAGLVLEATIQEDAFLVQLAP